VSELDRIMKKIRKTEDGHWLWTGSRCGTNREYGQVRFRGTKPVAHRAVWLLLRGPIPDGLDLLHQCGQTLCVNPDHLRPGTPTQNLLEALEVRGGKHWGPRGDKHVHSGLKDAEIEQLRTDHANGMKQVDLARKFNLHQAHVSMIINKKRRANVA